MTFTVSVDSGRLPLVVEAEVDGVRVMVQSAYLDGEYQPGLWRYLRRWKGFGVWLCGALWNWEDFDLWPCLKDKWRVAVENKIEVQAWESLLDGPNYELTESEEREQRLNEAGDRRAHEIIEGGEE